MKDDWLLKLSSNVSFAILLKDALETNGIEHITFRDLGAVKECAVAYSDAPVARKVQRLEFSSSAKNIENAFKSAVLALSEALEVLHATDSENLSDLA